MASTVPERFRRWAEAEIPGEGVRRFRVAFAGIWLCYDALDLLLHGTAMTQWIAGVPAAPLAVLQALLIIAELGLLVGWYARACAFAAFCLRGFVAWRFFRLNDFFYFCVTAAILSQFRLGRKGGRELSWPREVLIWQAAWIYFATALLKTSEAWVSGGHLFVRHQYLAAGGWPYPAFYRSLVSTLQGNAVLAWAGLAGEFAMAALLLARAPRRLVISLAVLLHGFAAVALNVWFFGASMIAQIALLL